MSRSLLIVESPGKTKTIQKYVGSDFTVLASYGHVRDLVPKEGAVDVEHDFDMKYELIERNIGHVNRIVSAAKQADTIYLATDLDREGEAISWHLLEILKERGVLKGKAVHRVTFAEITQKAIQEALTHPRQIDLALVDAQHARRALDFLVGFKLSPVLWMKVQKGLSAGRVQSPALRMIVEREEAIEAFKPEEYWTIAADMKHVKGEFQARLTKFHGQKVEQFSFVNEDQAMDARAELLTAANGRLTVSEVTSKEKRRRPAAPFTTSTLQQEASRKLGFSTTRTMKTAQALYEGISLGSDPVGLITYMRTDSTALSEDAVNDIRQVIGTLYGPDNLPNHPHVYKSKAKNAQEAHEAIRPSYVKRHPKDIAKYLDGDQFRLYELIWKRTVACQMIEATMSTVAVDFRLPNAHGGEACFRATGSTVLVPGFLRVYEEGKDSKDEDDENKRLPHMVEGEVVDLLTILADQHHTEPPPRFTEASLVKTMEEFGIGRPSTYASIIQVLINRKYVELDSKRFKPTDIGRAVGKFLATHFTQYVDYDFTAKLEDELDAVSRGEAKWVPLMRKFWEPFWALVQDKKVSVDRQAAQGGHVLGTDPVSGLPVGARLGKFGPVVYRGDASKRENKLEFASVPPELSISTITLEQALALFNERSALPRTLGKGRTGEDVIVGKGMYGPYAKEGKTYASIKDEDPLTITLEEANALLEARRVFLAERNVQDFGHGLKVLKGKFGHYVTDGTKNANVPSGKDPAKLTEAEAKAILEEFGKHAKHGKGGKFKKGGFKKGGHQKPSGKKGGKVDDLPM